MSLICKNGYRFSIVKITSFYRKQRHILTVMLSILCVMNIAPILQEAFKYIYKYRKLCDVNANAFKACS